MSVIDTTRFVLKKEAEVEAPVQAKKKKDSFDSLHGSSDENVDDDDNDSIFGDEYKEESAAIYFLEDTTKDNRVLQAGSKVKL